MRRFLLMLAALALLSDPLAAQGQAAGHVGQGGGIALSQLTERLPAAVADKVIAIVTEATQHGLPGQSVANIALEGAARGRSGEEIVLAAEAQARRLTQSQAAIESAGREPSAADVEAGAQALASGVTGEVVSNLAKGAPSGRSLTVPLAVLGGLVNRGLPSEVALQAVLARLTARANDNALAQMPGEAGRMIAAGRTPAEIGAALGAGTAPGATGTPMPPVSVPRNAPGRPTERPKPSSHPRGRP